MSPQASWMLVDEIVPRLKVLIPKTVAQLNGEDVDELVQDSTLMAARMLVSAESKGKKVTAGSIAHYTLLHLRSGRRSYASGSPCCLHPVNRMHNVEVAGFDDVVADEAGEPMTLNDVMSIDSADPSIEAARHLDWSAFLEQQNPRARAIIVCLVEGGQLKSVAAKFNVSSNVILNEKQRLGRRLLEFMGVDVIVDSTRPPRWKANLNATAEKMACREERKS